MTGSQLDAALELRELGWNVVAAPRGKKSPLTSWKQWQLERVTERAVREAFAGEPRNLFVITGSVSRLLVLDCDNDEAVAYWRERLGPVLEQTTRVKTGSGYHFYFRLPEQEPGKEIRGWSSKDPKVKWDVRAEGNGVIAPPSIHKTGRKYRWVKDHGPEALVDLPEGLAEQGSDDGIEGDGEPRSVLTHLLTHPPTEGGRNNWLARVAGHYAKVIPYRDAYDHLVREAAGKLDPPLPEAEVAKLLDSIWGAEEAKGGRAAPEPEDGEAWREPLSQPAEHTGWLVSGRTCILVQVRIKKGDSFELGLARWMDADLRVLGVVEGEGSRTYEVEVLRDGESVEAALPAATVIDPRQLAAWLANLGVTVGAPDSMSPRAMREGARLLRYLEAQDAEVLEAADALGWHDESECFICHEGVIRASGRGPHERLRPDPALKEWAPYRYGYAQGAGAVLEEVLRFHHEEVAAVFGSWWAACLLKPQIQRVSSQFPFMALEAASESGKTTGFFSLMLQLSGNNGGHSNPTRAALRDYLTGHRSGIVWMDDLDSLEQHGELLRNVTVGGSLVKKGEGNHRQVVAQLRGALVVSGESLGLMGQKALLDRAVLLEVPSPTDRRSRHDPSRPQWDDVLDLRARYPDLTEFAGEVVQRALGLEAVVGEFKGLRPGTGRFADKLAVVRVGARVLEAMLPGDGSWVVEQTDLWCERAEDVGSENALTLRLLPLALARTGWKPKPEGPQPDRRMVTTPAFVEATPEGEVVWFNPRLVADWWEREPPAGKRLDPRVESPTALVQQARAAGMGGARSAGGGRKTWRLVTGEGTQVYWKVPMEMSKVLLERSRGEEADDGQD